MRSDKFKLLISDISPNVLGDLKRVLQHGDYDVYAADTVDGISSLISQHHFDLILLDLMIPDLKPLELMDAVQTNERDTAFISVSDTSNYDVAIETVRRGAYDLLLKPYDGKFVIPLIQHAIYHSLNVSNDNVHLPSAEFHDDIYRFMVENSRDIQYLLDEDEKFVFVNKRVETLLGYNRSELIGKHYSEIVYQDDIDHLGYHLHDKRRHYFPSRNIEIRFKNKKQNSGPLYFEIKSVSLPSAVRKYQHSISSNGENYLKTPAVFGIAHDVTVRKKIEKVVNKKSSYDYLTGLPNKALFDDRLSLAVAQAKRDELMFSVMFIDLDGFKHINDTYGHKIGDKVLMMISTRMRSCLREGDTLARVGGDEFVFLLPQVKNKEEAEKVAKKLTTEVNKPFTIDGNNHRLSVSVGVSLYPDDGQAGETLIENADHAMYQIKHGRKNGYKFAQAI